MLEPVERGIEGALLNLQSVAGDLLDAEEHAIAVERAERDGFQDQEVECALQQFGGIAHASLLDNRGE